MLKLNKSSIDFFVSVGSVVLEIDSEGSSLHFFSIFLDGGLGSFQFFELNITEASALSVSHSNSNSYDFAAPVEVFFQLVMSY